MTLPYDQLLQVRNERARFSYGDRETILYALGVGFGEDPLAAAELPFVSECAGLKASPTMASLFGRMRGVTSRAGIDHNTIVHAEQRLTLHQPMPAGADIVVDEHVAAAFDKGPGKGALIVVERVICEAASGARISTALQTLFARGGGGFGGPRDGAPEPHRLPDRAADLVVESRTRPDQALLYALSGDPNPLHRDPHTAKAAGFDRPILHGLCTYGVAGRAILREICHYDPSRIVGLDARFSAPAFPGETIVTEIWIDQETVAFRASAKERGVLILDNGRCLLAS